MAVFNYQSVGSLRKTWPPKGEINLCPVYVALKNAPERFLSSNPLRSEDDRNFNDRWPLMPGARRRTRAATLQAGFRGSGAASPDLDRGGFRQATNGRATITFDGGG